MSRGGLLALSENEDELAGVLAHEIVHVEERHSMKQMSRQRLPTLLSLPGRVVGNLISKDLGRIINAPVGLVGSLNMARYGRGQESESDRIGQELSAAAGYDPASLADILERMDGFGELVSGEKRNPSFFDSHPPTPDRSRNVKAYAEQLQVARRQALAATDEEFLAKLEGLVWGTNPAQGEFRGELFLHPDLDIAIDFPEGWATLNSASMIGAFSPERDALTFYGIMGRGSADDIKELASKRREELERQAGLQPSRDETLMVGDHDARLLAYTDQSGKQPMHIFFIWISFGELVHQFVGMAPEKHRPAVKAMVASLRALTDEERVSFLVRQIRIVRARDGESLAELSARTQNILDDASTRLINGLSPDQTLEAQQAIKIVTESKYSPSPAP